jgi:hypothetical protein
MIIDNSRFKELLLSSALAIVLCIFALSMQAQTKIHMVAFCDTGDEKIGKNVQLDLNTYRQLMTDISSALKSEGIVSSSNIYSGAQCTPSQARNYIKGLSCQDDIILFFYSGHGGRSHNDDAETKFPRMSLGGSGEPVKITDVISTLEKKHPRLIVMVTDCCNSYYDRSSDRQSMNNSLGGSGEGFRTLFLKNKGVACITAASPGEFGWCSSNGGYLTVSIKEAFYEADQAGNSASWDNLFKNTRNNTYNATRKDGCPKTQTPYYEVHVSDSSTDSPEPTIGDDTTDYSTIDDTDDDTGGSSAGSSVGNNSGGYTTTSGTTSSNNNHNSGHKKKKSFSGGKILNFAVLLLLGLIVCFKLPKWIKMPSVLELIARIIGVLLILKAVFDLFSR